MWHDFDLTNVDATSLQQYLAYYYNKAVSWGKDVVVTYNDGFAGGRDGNLKVLVLLVRQAGDEDVPASAVAEYVRFARKFGGMVRVIPTGNAAETANGILAAMARGGDLLDVRLESGKLAEVLSPGRGASLAFNDPARLPRDRRVRVSARALDAEVRAETTPALVKREWLDPLVETAASARRAWSGANTNMTVAILPPPVQTNKPSDGVVRGRMDPERK